MASNEKQTLEKIYSDPKHPAGLSNPSILYKYSKSFGINKKAVEEFLREQESYTLHRQVRKRFPRNRIVVDDIDEQWEMDLADLPSLMQYNDGYRYIFCCIDVLSKYAWALALKRKTGPVLTEGFRKIIDGSDRKPKMVRVDKGGEFVNEYFKGYCKEQDIHFFTSQNEVKAAIVERFQRTLKGYMWRYFTKTGSYRYIDKLQDFIYAYNHRVHRSIKRRPVDVTWKNSEEVRKILYKKPKKSKQSKKKQPKKKSSTKYKFEIGDHVRITKTKGIFEKGYQQNWTLEIFTVSQRLPRQLPVYRLKDSQGEEIVGTFYEVELQKVTPPEFYTIEKVIKERGSGKNKELLVKWQGYPTSANSWIKASQLKQ